MKPGGRAGALLLVLLLLTAAGTVAGEGDPAILEKGPIPVKGIPYLPVNALPAYYGEYTTESGAFNLLLTSEPLVPGKDWQPVKGPLRGLQQIPSREELVFYYRTDEGESLFFSFPEDFPEPWNAITVFLSRYRYFKGIQRNSREIPFPAILNLN